MKELLVEIAIPLYRRTYISSNSVRPRYYEQGKKKLPLKYCDKHKHKTQGIFEADGVNYTWEDFPVIRKKVKRIVRFLVETATGERVIANERKVGKQQISNVSGEALIFGGMRHTRNSMLGQIKDQLRQYLMVHRPILRFPIIIELELFDVLLDDPFVKGQKWDVGNRVLPYNKAFEDVLQDCKIIPDDDAKYVTGPPQSIFTPITRTEDRKLVYRIYADRRPCIVNNPDYQRILGEKLK